MKVAKQIQEFMHMQGARYVFGIVGREGSAISFKEFDGLEFILTRHETSAGLMAIAVSRFSSSPQFCFATIGPGVTNLMTPLATAALDRYPLIAIGTQLETYETDFNNAHQCVDNVSIARPLVKFAYEIRDPSEVISTLEKAVTTSMTQPIGPSFISIPVNILNSDAIPFSHEQEKSLSHRRNYDIRDSNYEVSLDRVVQLLSQSKNPLIVIGDAALRIGEAKNIVFLAEKLNIPVISSYSAKGVLPPDHPLYYGIITPYMDSILNFPALKTLFDTPDLLLLIGYDLVEHLYPKLWGSGNDKKVARIGAFANNTPKVLCPDVDAVGPISEGLQYLLRNVETIRVKQPYDISSLRQRVKLLLEDPTDHPEGILPNQVFAVLNNHFKDYILANDVGLHRHASALFYRANRPLDFVTSAGLSSFGTGLPLGIGSKIANPEREVVVICGDGGFLSNPGELETAARLGLKLTVLLYNNCSSGLIERYEMMGHGYTNPLTTSMHDVDFTGMAKSFGCQGIQISRIVELRQALKKADEYIGPTLIQIPIHYPNLYINEFTKNYHINHRG